MFNRNAKLFLIFYLPHLLTLNKNYWQKERTLFWNIIEHNEIVWNNSDHQENITGMTLVQSHAKITMVLRWVMSFPCYIRLLKFPEWKCFSSYKIISSCKTVISHDIIGTTNFLHVSRLLSYAPLGSIVIVKIRQKKVLLFFWKTVVVGPKHLWKKQLQG